MILLNRSFLLTLLLSVDAAWATPVLRVHSPYAVKDSFHVPRQWSQVGPAPPENTINLQIGLKQSQFSELERHLYEVSDPAHPRYGQHLSAAEVNELVKPTDDALKLVHEWLFDHDVNEDQLDYTPAKDWIKLSLPVRAVEDLLDTKYYVFQHEDGSQVVRTPKWSLPVHLHEHIVAVQPTNSFFRDAPRSSKPNPEVAEHKILEINERSSKLGSRSTRLKVAEDDDIAIEIPTIIDPSTSLTVADVCNITSVTPLCLRTLYGTVNYTPQVPGQNQVGLTNYLGQANNRSDIYLFLQTFRPEAAAAAFEFTVEIIANGSDQQTPLNSSQRLAGLDLEGNLDAETIIGITWPTPLTTYNTGGSPRYVADDFTPTDTNEPYLVWVQHVLADPFVPQVISTSYADDEQTVPYSYAVSVCNQFAQLGARGVSLLFGSGDEGVGTRGYCYTNDGTNTPTFLPEFPASCPYVTAVGATKNFTPEVVAYDSRNDFVSGGGYSRYFPRPPYQEAVVPNYTASLGNQFSGLYNPDGRAYPDMAAQGQRYITIWNGAGKLLDGTSASTPTAASIISLVNDALLAAGKPVLGFLNPWLYSIGYTAFTDVTNGSAIGCNTTGFPAAVGWDAVTGFGTPYFPDLVALALNTSY